MHLTSRAVFMTRPSIRLVVGEDQPLMRQAMVDEFRSYPGVEVVGMAGTIPELEQILRQTEPDMLVLEMILGGRYTSLMLQDTLRRLPQLRVLVASTWETEFDRLLGWKAGAHGFLSKQDRSEVWRQTFWEVARGKKVWLPGRSYPGAEACNLFDREARVQTLSVREMEVFGLIGNWKSTEEMAESLGISPKTVEIHRIHIKQKLGFNAASELLRFAVEWVKMKLEWEGVEAAKSNERLSLPSIGSNGEKRGEPRKRTSEIA